MKFLAKDPTSPIAAAGLRYITGRNNAELLRLLCCEQKGFCAYTERVFQEHDSVDVEHFDRRKKGNDNYFNYYAVLHWANMRKRKKEGAAEGAQFFESLFFQSPSEFARRIKWVAETNTYEEVDLADVEAKLLIEYLGFNDLELWRQRRNHLARLADLFDCAQWGPAEQRAWFERHTEELSFVSALEGHLGLDLSGAVEALSARLGDVQPEFRQTSP